MSRSFASKVSGRQQTSREAAHQLTNRPTNQPRSKQANRQRKTVTYPEKVPGTNFKGSDATDFEREGLGLVGRVGSTGPSRTHPEHLVAGHLDVQRHLLSTLLWFGLVWFGLPSTHSRTAQHSTAQHSTAQHSTAQHSMHQEDGKGERRTLTWPFFLNTNSAFLSAPSAALKACWGSPST